jgi:hypothetical protein
MRSYTVVKGDVENDKEAILSVVHRNLSVAYSDQRYDWNYKQCPYGKASCWLLKHESSDSFVGSASLFPRRMIAKGKKVPAGIIGDFSIDKKHRGLGPAIELLKGVVSDTGAPDRCLLYETPNEKSSPVFSRVGYKEIGRVRVYLKPLNMGSLSKDFLPRYLRSDGVLKIVDSCGDVLSRERRVKDRPGHTFEMPNRFDERFDVLWGKVSGQFGIIGERSSDFLNWRYGRSYAYYRTFCVLDEGNELGAYLVYRVKDNICYVADMLAMPSGNLLGLLMAKFITHQRKAGIGAIAVRYMGNRSIRKMLRSFNFMVVNDSTKAVLYADGLPDQSYLLDDSNWHFLAGDMDI